MENTNWWYYAIDKVLIVIILGLYSLYTNRNLEKFKNDLIRKNKVFEDRYSILKDLIAELYIIRTNIEVYCNIIENIENGSNEYEELNNIELDIIKTSTKFYTKVEINKFIIGDKLFKFARIIYINTVFVPISSDSSVSEIRNVLDMTKEYKDRYNEMINSLHGMLEEFYKI